MAVSWESNLQPWCLKSCQIINCPTCGCSEFVVFIVLFIWWHILKISPHWQGMVYQPSSNLDCESKSGPGFIFSKDNWLNNCCYWLARLPSHLTHHKGHVENQQFSKHLEYCQILVGALKYLCFLPPAKNVGDNLERHTLSVESGPGSESLFFSKWLGLLTLRYILGQHLFLGLFRPAVYYIIGQRHMLCPNVYYGCLSLA